MRVNRAGLADILGVSVNTIVNYLKEGLPVEEAPQDRGTREYTIDTAKAIKWLIGHKSGKRNESGDFASAKARNEAASAELKEYELAERRKEMVSVDDVAAEVSETFHLIRSRLRSMPARLGQVLSVVSEPQEIERITRIEVDGALSELSNYGKSSGSNRELEDSNK